MTDPVKITALGVFAFLALIGMAVSHDNFTEEQKTIRHQQVIDAARSGCKDTTHD